MSNISRVLAFCGGGLGIIIGVFLVLHSGEHSQLVTNWELLGKDSVVLAMGIDILIAGLIGLSGAFVLSKNRSLGIVLLIFSIPGGFAIGYTIIWWFVPAMLEFVAIIYSRARDKKQSQF